MSQSTIVKKSVTHLADDIARLNMADSLYILLYGSLMFTFCIEMITILLMYIGNASIVQALRFGKI